MGLYVHNLGNMPDTVDGRDYYIYVLNYGWHEPLTQTLRENFGNMARLAAQNRSVVVAGLDEIHFADEVFSWHNINGEDGEKILPAILISTLTPLYFHNYYSKIKEKTELKDKLLLIPLKSVCKTTDEIIPLIQSIFNDIKEKKLLSGFEVARKLNRNGIQRFFDAIILQPNLSGLGLDIKKLLKQ